MAKKKKKGAMTPTQLRDEAKKYSDKAKSNFKDAGKAFIHGSHQGVRSLYGAAKGAIKAAPLGDKTPMIKGAWNGFWDTEPFKEGTKDIGKFYGGIAKGMFNGAVSKQLKKQAKIKEFSDKLKGELKNDLSWYNNYPDSTSEMIGPNFNTRLGTKDDLLDLNSNTTVKPTMPSFASIMVKLTRGDDTDHAVTSAINRIYTTIRQANSGSTNWSPYQLDGYIYNYRRIIALYSVMIRALKYLNKYSVVDNNVPYALFASLGFDYDNFKTNSAQLRNELLAVRTRLTSYAIPSFDILKRTYWLFSYGYTDSDDIKHQTYHFVPIIKDYYSMSYNALSTMSPNFNPTIGTTTDGMTVADSLLALKSLTTEFFNNEVYSVISGDIVKAYGVDNLFILDKLPDIYELPNVGYNEEVLAQIQNLYIPRTGQGSELSMTLTHSSTDDVGLTETVTYTETGYANVPTIAKTQTYVNSYLDGITNLDVLGMTRLIGLASNDTASFTLETYGTEIVERLRYFMLDVANLGQVHHLRSFDTHSLQLRDVTTATNVEWYSMPEFCWAAFDWSPRMIELINYYTSGSTTVSTGVGATYFDFNNYSKIDSIEMLRAIHNVALQSLYYSPLLSRVSTHVIELPEKL